MELFGGTTLDAGATELLGTAPPEEAMTEPLGARLLEPRGWLEDATGGLDDATALELADATPLELRGALEDTTPEAEAETGADAEALAEPEIDPDTTPSVPRGAFGSLGAYVVNIESGPQAGPLDVDVNVVPLKSHPVRVLKL